MNFRDLKIIPPILKAINEEGYKEPSPIQCESIPPALKGKDILGCAQTGTGKTAAFAVPIIQLLSANNPQRSNKIGALILTPTRELAIQIDESFRAYGRYTDLRYTVIFGGVAQGPQVKQLKRGVDVLVATPGRLLDLMDQKIINLKDIQIFVLDEADRMLDMGFINDIKKIIAKLPKNRQTLFFSATMPANVSAIADSILKKPVNVAVTPVSSTADTIEQKIYFVDKVNKDKLLATLLGNKDVESTLVFTRTKHGADKVARSMAKKHIAVSVIHGNKSQSARQAALNSFKAGKISALIATDIAARGIDIDELSHVINYDLPEPPETYVHRIGRTGRAGLGGIALSFCSIDEKKKLQDIEKLIGKPIIEVENHPYPMKNFVPTPPKPQQASRKKQEPKNNATKRSRNRTNSRP